jgi:hypothetical protein
MAKQKDKATRPPMREALRCLCFECCGDMVDGRIDCEITTCPVYYWQPYREHDPDFTWRTEGSHLQKNRRALRERMKERNAGEDDLALAEEEGDDND